MDWSVRNPIIKYIWGTAVQDTNMTRPTNNIINKQQEKETNANVNQKMIEMMQTIQQNIKELNTTMSYLKNHKNWKPSWNQNANSN